MRPREILQYLESLSFDDSGSDEEIPSNELMEDVHSDSFSLCYSSEDTDEDIPLGKTFTPNKYGYCKCVIYIM